MGMTAESELLPSTRVQLRNGAKQKGIVMPYMRECSQCLFGLFPVRLDTCIWQICHTNDVSAWEWTTRSPKGDPAAAREMASASWSVAAAWRQIATATTLPWWILAALESAAAAFESQARDWETRAKNEKP